MAEADLLERYRLARLLGVGSVSRTYLAIQRGAGELRRAVAIKDFLPVIAEQPDARARLLERCRLAATVDHHRVLPVVDQGFDASGRLLVVAPYVLGESLVAVLARCAQLQRAVPPQLAARIIADVCAALQAAHEAEDPLGRRPGLLHGAVRPSNVLLSYHGLTALADLGCFEPHSVAVDAGLTPARAHFLAPELFEGAEPDPRSDVYSAGVLLYVLLTLRYPHDAHHTVREVAAAKRQRAPVAPGARNSAVPGTLETILQSALSARPDDRPATAAELQSELEAALAGLDGETHERALSSYVTALFGRRSRAKRTALNTLLALPHPAEPEADTHPEVAPEAFPATDIDDLLGIDLTTAVESKPPWGDNFRTIPDVPLHAGDAPAPEPALRAAGGVPDPGPDSTTVRATWEPVPRLVDRHTPVARLDGGEIGSETNPDGEDGEPRPPAGGYDAEE